MSSPVPYDNGLRPARVFDPVRITLWSSMAIFMGALWALLLLFTEFLVIRQLIYEGFTAAAWARFLLPNVLILPFYLAAAKRNMDRFSYRVKLQEDAMEITPPQDQPQRIDYGEIDQLSVPGEGEMWFRVKARDREEIVVPSLGIFLRKHHREDVVRVVGARLRPDARLERGDPPDDDQEVDRLYWLTLYDPPPVAMAPGKRYRYLPGANALTHLTNRAFGIVIMPVAFLTNLLVMMVKDGHWSGWEIIPILLILLNTAPVAAYFKNGWRKDDLFEGEPNCLWVIRGNRRFKITNPEPVYPPYADFAPVKRPILRYGRGWNAYYFDPRFIEEDVPEPWAEEDP